MYFIVIYMTQKSHKQMFLHKRLHTMIGGLDIKVPIQALKRLIFKIFLFCKDSLAIKEGNEHLPAEVYQQMQSCGVERISYLSLELQTRLSSFLSVQGHLYFSFRGELVWKCSMWERSSWAEQHKVTSKRLFCVRLYFRVLINSITMDT